MNIKKYCILPILLVLFGTLAAQNGQELPFQKWALTPPMGWNSWDCFGPSVVESEVKANADYMAANLKQHGWEYVVVDIRWYVDNQTTGTYNAFANSTFIYDQYGRYMPSPTRFPSSKNGAGFKPLADYVHSKGLKFGIHIMRGVPKEAVNNNLPIKNGNGKTAKNIYSTDSLCTWLGDNYTIKANLAGAQEYYNSIFELYAEWGVDFIKIDDLSRPYHQGEIDLIRNAIDNCGRPMVLSLSPGETPVEKFAHVKTHANMWRTVDDFWDNWSQLNYQFAVCNKWAPYISPGNWPDADMLPLGHIAIRGERGADRRTNFTQDEQYTLMTLWTIFKSPLMFGGHLPDNDTFTNALLTNPEVLDMHNKSINNRQLFNNGDQIAWTADDPYTGDKYLALFNNGGSGFVKSNNLLYRSGTISRLTDGYGTNIDMAIPAGSKELYLIVSDDGDGFTNDHADWINPTLYKSNGDSVKLTNLNWEIASTGWGAATKNKSVSGGSLNVKGTVYSNGIGTHSRSVIMFPIPEDCVRFKCFAGLDMGGTNQSGGATVEFMVSNQDPTMREVAVEKAIANSGRISRSFQRAGVHLEADITGASKLYLVVTDAGDNFNYDHADWINPTIYKSDGISSLKLTTLTPVSATSGWDVVRTNKSLNGNTLKVNGVSYNNGFGVNSYSIIEFNLPEGYTTFKSFCGFDDEVLASPNGVTMEFLVFTQSPVNDLESAVPVNLASLGFDNGCFVRDLWAKKDSGLITGTQFAPMIRNHGAKLYRLSAPNRSYATNISLTVNPTTIRIGESAQLTATVQKLDASTNSIAGSVLFMLNDSVIGVVPLDANGNATFPLYQLNKGTYTYRAKYSGNTHYQPQNSNTASMDVNDYTNVGKLSRNTTIKIVSKGGMNYLSGLKSGDCVTFIDQTGRVISTNPANKDTMPIRVKGTTIIKVETDGEYIILKHFS